MANDAPVIRWGCIGTGNIAMAMAQQLQRLPCARREAICSASGRSAASVEDKRAQYGYSRALTLEELVSDPCVDVVYVASANNAHAKHCLAALRGGKPVLCEKPLTLSWAEAEEVFAEAERQKLFVMDGTFSAYLPAMSVLRARLPELGALRRVELHKKIRLQIMRNSPIINSRELGGGLFDGCGSYTAQMLCVLFGAAAVSALRPEDLNVASTPGPTPTGEVDWDTTVTMRLAGAEVLLTHRATDEARQSLVLGEHGSLAFTLPRLEEVIVNGMPIATPYADSPPFVDLYADEPGAPRGLHPGLGEEVLAVHRAMSAQRKEPGSTELPLDVIRAMNHFLDLVRNRLPTHVHFRPSATL
eukprot:TRINITY_DN73346_c0_g1_i1.p1 TRINITY_DN73346_c0_g1~~TRINITY_DN73346_c0_g1_i1.p1  ORF type:complete len:359 (+),score=44.38 TRINITY_DN73346_c0_g1_i1:84-1160(+)